MSAAPRFKTAAADGLVTCHDCHLLVRVAPPGHALNREGDVHVGTPHCPRCHSALHARKPNALARAWALVISAFILYIPANLYPVMRVSSLGRSDASTILSGVAHLFESGMWPLALVVFFASVVVPLCKLFALIYLLVQAGRGAPERLVDRTKLYRLTEALGRWSMVDIYVVAILSAVVQLGALAQVEPEAGAVYFGAVVVVTMFAAESFDPRVAWDRAARRKAAQAPPAAPHAETSPPATAETPPPPHPEHAHV